MTDPTRAAAQRALFDADDDGLDGLFPLVDGRPMTPAEETAWLEEMVRPALEDIERGDVYTEEEFWEEMERFMAAAKKG